MPAARKQWLRFPQVIDASQLALELTPAAVEELARAGFDPIYGARPLKRTIQKDLVQPLAVRLLQGEFGDGDLILIDVGPNGGLAFKKAVVGAV